MQCLSHPGISSRAGHLHLRVGWCPLPGLLQWPRIWGRIVPAVICVHESFLHKAEDVSIKQSVHWGWHVHSQWGFVFAFVCFFVCFWVSCYEQFGTDYYSRISGSRSILARVALGSYFWKATAIAQLFWKIFSMTINLCVGSSFFPLFTHFSHDVHGFWWELWLPSFSPYVILSVPVIVFYILSLSCLHCFE